MATPIATSGLVARCPHGGLAMPVPTAARVTSSAARVLLASDSLVISGCPNLPRPCVRAVLGPASRMSVSGTPVALAVSGTCFDATSATSGLLSVAATQVRAQAS